MLGSAEKTVKLFSKNSNLYACKHDISTLEKDGQADRQLAMAILHSIYRCTVIIRNSNIHERIILRIKLEHEKS